MRLQPSGLRDESGAPLALMGWCSATGADPASPPWPWMGGPPAWGERGRKNGTARAPEGELPQGLPIPLRSKSERLRGWASTAIEIRISGRRTHPLDFAGCVRGLGGARQSIPDRKRPLRRRTGREFRSWRMRSPVSDWIGLSMGLRDRKKPQWWRRSVSKVAE